MACSGPFEKPDKAPNWAKVTQSQTVSLLSCVPGSRWMMDDDDDDDDDDDGDDDDAADDDDLGVDHDGDDDDDDDAVEPYCVLLHVRPI